MTDTTNDRFVPGRITDDGLAKLRMLIGYPNPTVPQSSPVPHYSVVTSDAIRHYANGCGDDNPLFCDPEYGKSTVWGSQIAPPTFGYSATWDRSRRPSKELRAQTRGALRGVHLFASGTETFYYQPVVPGDRLESRVSLMDVEEKEHSNFSGGRAVVTHNGNVAVNADQRIVSFGTSYMFHTEREGSANKAKERTIELGAYTDEDLARIDKAYENEFVRGSTDLIYEDVTVGDALPTMVKGPLRVMDIIGMHIGWGWGNYIIGPLKLDFQNRKRMPAFYGKNEAGVWDTMQRLHWDPLFAQAIGNPTTYDYANMRICWVSHYLTNWIGDDSWLYRMKVDLRKFNFVGDTTWFEGEVVGKRIEDGIGPAVEVVVRGVNQRGEVTTEGEGTILLVSREHGPVRLPEPAEHVHEWAPEPE